MSKRGKKWLRFVLRWGIAAVGVYWVLANISLHDRVLIVDPRDGWPVSLALAAPATEKSEEFSVFDAGGSLRSVKRTQLLARADREKVVVKQAGQEKQYAVLGLQVMDEANRSHWPIVVAPPRNLLQRYLNLHNARAMSVQPAEVVGPNRVAVSYPLIDVGINHLLADADVGLLIAAILIFPVTFLITSFRWHRLLRVLGVEISLSRAFVLNMVGNFYNTFMPGSTGGDLLKAYYASRHTLQYKTRAVMSVIIDRVIGLLALVILGGMMAAYQYATSTSRLDPAVVKCRQVALASAAILAGVGAGLFVLYHPRARRWLGVDLLLSKLPMQTQVSKALEVMEIYRTRPGLILWAILITLPVHITVVMSAALAGKAFDLPIALPFYFVAVPVIVLVGAIPISPQGAGVMEFFAILLTRSQGATVSQAVALTMSIRLVQVLWNLTGGILVLRGGYHAPSEAEQHEMDVAPPAPAGR